MPDSPRTTEEVARLLSDPAAYDPPPASVRVIQTHGSFVFLTGRWAFKMKRAVKYAFFDFSTLEKRREALERELRLNRRLAPEVYLGVLPVVERDGRLAVGRAGEEAVEYLLRMAELPGSSRRPTWRRKRASGSRRGTSSWRCMTSDRSWPR